MVGRAEALPAGAAAPAARPRSLWREIWRKRMLYLALLPTFALLSVFEYYPPLSAMYHAFFQWTGSSDPKFVGLANFAELATDKVFWPSIGNMLRVLAVHLAFQLTVPFLVAELLFHLRIERLSYVFRLLFVVPLVVPWIVSLLIWQFIYDPSVGLLNALPDKQLWKRLEREGRLLGEASGNNTTCSLNFKTRMDPAMLIQGYQSIMQTIYSPREYYQRALDSMKRTAQQFVEPQHYNVVSAVTAFARVMLKLGIVDGERKEFWRFFTQALVKHHDRLAETLRLAAMGYHFRKLNDAYSEPTL